MSRYLLEEIPERESAQEARRHLQNPQAMVHVCLLVKEKGEEGGKFGQIGTVLRKAQQSCWGVFKPKMPIGGTPPVLVPPVFKSVASEQRL